MPACTSSAPAFLALHQTVEPTLPCSSLQLLSLDDLGFDGLAPLAGALPPLLVLIASSTGDGEAPDNAAGTYAALRQRQEQQQASGQEGALCGLRFTLLGLGSSDFSTFMNVPRSLKAGWVMGEGKMGEWVLGERRVRGKYWQGRRGEWPLHLSAPHNVLLQ